MRKFLIGLVVSLSLMSQLGCASPAWSQGAMALGDMRFATNSEPVVGLTIQQVVEKFGPAVRVINDGCQIPLVFRGKMLGVTKGDQLRYEHVADNKNKVERMICTLEGVVVSDRLQIFNIKGGQISIHTLDTLDPTLAAEISIGKEDLEEFPQRYNDPMILYGEGLEI